MSELMPRDAIAQMVARSNQENDSLRARLAEVEAERDLLHSRYRGLYALWCRVARAMTPQGGPDITDEEVADRAEAAEARAEQAEKALEDVAAGYGTSVQEIREACKMSVSEYAQASRHSLARQRDEARAKLEQAEHANTLLSSKLEKAERENADLVNGYRERAAGEMRARADVARLRGALEEIRDGADHISYAREWAQEALASVEPEPTEAP